MVRHFLSAAIMGGWLVLGLAHGRAGVDYGQTGGGSGGGGPPVALAGDGSENPKPFTITATLREEYDDNIFTSNTNKVSSFKTEIAPSILLDLPMGESDFSARYTFGLDYYMNRDGGSFDMSHEFVGQFKHAFSERFNLNVAEQFNYSTEPNLLGATGTLYRNGAYYTNTINAGFNGQWTPLFGTSTTYSNTIVRYEDATESVEQDNVENTGAQNFSFAILPKVNLVFGGIVDEINYDKLARGYTSYTGNGGLDWQALPSLSLGGRVGGTVTETDQSSSEVSPYGALTLNWKLGERSTLAFNYVHDVVPTDVVTAEGQIADRFTTTFRYDITPDVTAHLEGIYTHGEYTQQLITPGTVPSFSEDDVAFDTGLDYHVNRHFDLETGYIFSNVSSDLNFRDYTRNQIYVGVRGTY